MILIILLTLPLLISAEITINVLVNTNKSDIKITHSGVDYKVITDTEFKVFNITTAQLNKGMRFELGKVPDDIFFKDPTEYGDLYNKFKWEPVIRSLRVNKARVIDIINEDVVLQTHDFINNTTTPLKSKRCMYTTVQNTAQSSWFIEGIPNDKISYNLDFNFSYGKLKYKNKWRSDKQHTSKIPIGVIKEGIVTIKPMQTVVTKLTATKTILLIELDYKAVLDGSVVANYAQLYGKYHFWAPSIQDIMKAAAMKNEIYTKEQIEVRCYLNPRLEVYDKLTGEIEETPKKKRPLMRIMRNKNMHRILYTKIKKPKQQKKEKN